MNHKHLCSGQSQGDSSSVFPLSIPQKGLWFAHQMVPDAAGKVFKVAGYILLPGEIIPEMMEAAVRQAVSEMETLHITTSYDDGNLFQTIRLFSDWEFPVIDLSQSESPETAAIQWLDARLDFPVSLEQKGPMFDFALLKTQVDQFYLYGSAHHITTDGYGFMALVMRFAEVYTALVAESTPPVSGFLGVATLLEAEQAYLTSSSLLRDREYWLNLMGQHHHPVCLSSGQSIPCSDVLNEQLKIPRDTYARLNSLAEANGSNFATLLTALTAIYLYRMTGEMSLMVGFVHSGRMSRALRRTTGMTANVLPLGIQVSPEMSLAELLAQVKSNISRTARHSRYYSEELRQALGQSGESALWFCTSINYVPSQYEVNFGDIAGSVANTAIGPVDDFGFTFYDRGPSLGLELYLTANAALYAQKDVRCHIQRLCHFLTEVATADVTFPCQIDVMSVEEHAQVLSAGQGVIMDLPEHQGIHQFVEQQALSQPNDIAVVFEDQSLTYTALNQQANQLAYGLIAKGVGPGSRVAIAVERSCAMVVAMLATLKAGGAYVPMDPVFPADRLQYMLADSEAAVLLTDGSIPLDTTFGGQMATLHVIDILQDQAWYTQMPTSNPVLPEMDPAQLAYVIYTSGSTGRPKGVMVPHRTVMNFLISQQQQHTVTQDMRLLAITTISFDIHVLEIYLPLISGATLHIASKDLGRDGAQLGRYLSEQNITLFQATPATWKLLLASGWQGAPNLTGLIGGESFTKPLADAILEKVGALWNMYGPTETTVWSSTWPIRVSDPTVFIGQPINNTQIYILDPQGQPVPLGATGEIYIAGEGVTQGYMNRPDLTEASFLADPFSTQVGARMYRTGDLGRWHACGAIECLGRSDFQVKVRGYRIELGEIESALLGCEGIADAVVMAPTATNGEAQLVAYYVTADRTDTDSADTERKAAGGGAIDSVNLDEVKAQLRSQLPDYMVPVAYMALDAFPLTPNGKVDRKALPAPDEQALVRREYEAPEGEVETRLAEIWQSLLGVAQVGRHDNFFELGGHSLLAMQLISRVRASLGCELALATIFTQPVLCHLADEVATLTPDKTGSASQPPVIQPLPAGMTPPLSLAQQRLWLLSQIDEAASAAYIMEGSVTLQGVLNVSALRQALDHVVVRHHVLRTTIEVQEGVAVQHVGNESQGIPLFVVEVDSHDAAEQVAFDPHFDLSTGPLIQGQLIHVDTNVHVLRLAMHHIISDGWSIGLLIREVSQLYTAFIQHQSDPLPPLAIQYGDYAAWQQAHLQGARLQAQQQYWIDQLQGAPDCLTLPTDRPRPGTQQFAGAETTVVLDDVLTAELRALSQQHGCTLFMTLLAGWSALMGRLANQDDVVIGTPSAGRTHTEVEALIGMFVNTQAIRVDLSAHPTAAHLLAQVKETALAALAHQDIPFEQIVEVLAPTRSLAHSPVFQVMFAFQNLPENSFELPGLRLSPIKAKVTTVQFDLNLFVYEVDGKLVASLHYATALFDQVTAQRYLGYWQQLLQAMATAPEQPIDVCPLLGERERQQVIHDFNATARNDSDASCIHQHFEQQVLSQPNATAVCCEDASLTYAQLNQQANQLAHWLVEQGVRPDSRVAVSLERSCDLVVALVAILKSGGAYVPLDPGYPQERLEYMLADSQPVALLTTQALARRLGPIPAATTLVDMAASVRPWMTYATANLAPESLGLTCRHLAYIIYTSGSTGNPKGVMNEHRGVVNRLHWMKDDYGFAPDDVVLQKTPFSFDVSVWEFFCPLWAGATLVMAKPEGHKDPVYLRELIEQREVSILHFVPPMLQMFLEVVSPQNCPSLRLMFCSGEALLAETVRKTGVRLPQVALHNLYGPTEAAVDVTAWACPGDLDGDRVSIGAPVANTQMYVLDHQGEPVPIGVSGELYIGGVQVARGYLNRPELTAERFVLDPFSTEPDARLYRTGDVGCWLADGTIEYQGRNDDQVKIRGFRIELGEISSVLQGCTGVQEAVVVALPVSQSNPDKRLVAYYTEAYTETDTEVYTEAYTKDMSLQDGHQRVTIEALKAELSAQLPAHMVPAAYVVLDEMPLTPNGKVDRKALPAPDEEALVRHGYEAPEGEVERCLAEIWQALLGIEQVGRHDNFFELGGHSLMAVQLIERLRQQDYTLVIRDLFAQPTLAMLAACLDNQVPQGSVVIPPNLIPAGCQQITPEMLPLADLTPQAIDTIAGKVAGGMANIQDIYPLAPLQEGILFHHLLEQQGDPYVMRFIQAFTSEAEVDDFVSAVQAVIQRHDILRTAVVWEGMDIPMQVVWREAPISLQTLAFTGADVTGTDTLNSSELRGTDTLNFAGSDEIATRLQQHFDPSHTRMDVQRAPMIEAYKVADPQKDRWLLCFLFHHLCNDHTTLELLVEEVMAHLAGQADQLPQPLPFRNFVAQAATGPGREAHLAYFRDQLRDIDEPCAPFGLLERDTEHPIQPCHLEVDDTLAQALRAQARQRRMSAASLFHLAWGMVVRTATGGDDVVFGTVLFGRMGGGEGADRALGMFLNTLPLRLSLGDVTVDEALTQTHHGLMSLLDHEHTSLALAQQCSGVSTQTPLFSSLLNYRYQGGSQQLANGNSDDALSVVRPTIERSVIFAEENTNYPLSLAVNDIVDGGFSLDLHVESVIGGERVGEMMLEALAQLVDALDRQTETPIHCLNVLSTQEREHVLYGVNQTATPFPDQLCIHQLVEQQARYQPNDTAVVFEDHTLTYAALNQQANQLAHGLIAKGIAPGSRVAIAVERGCNMVVAMLATLKAGGAYVPMDPVFPADRLQYMLADSEAAVLITDGSIALEATFGDSLATLHVIDIQQDRAWYAQMPATDPVLPEIDATQLAYVIYTSGSTGRPKGVMVPHRTVMNFLTSQQQQHAATQDMRLLAITTISFDIHVLEIYLPLISGATLHIASKDLGRDGVQLGRYLTEQNITVFQATPATWKLLLASGWQGAPNLTGLIGGESFTKPLADAILEKVGALWNMYGPTETTVWSSTWPIRVNDPTVFIGQPINNTQIYILDPQGQPVPLGATGELYIAGEGVTQGYMNRPDLTAASFLADPFSPQARARMYRTGDLGRWHISGAIECLGRCDFQVKVRGYRIELGEIESALLGCEGIADAVVMAPTATNGEAQLVAYYVTADRTDTDSADIERKAAGGGAIDSVNLDEVKAQLRSQLPDYMVPVAYMALDAFPLTPNGKVDRKALPAPDESALVRREYEAPQGEVETRLAEIWQTLLGVEHVSRHDDFFELGGHSLLAVQLTSRVRAALQCEVALTTLFDQPVLHALASGLTDTIQHDLARPTLPEIVPMASGELPPLSLAQRRLWFLAQMDPTTTAAYVVAGGVRLKGKLNVDALQKALNQIVVRHAPLRTHFADADGVPVQIIGDVNQGFPLTWLDGEAMLDELAPFKPEFDLTTGPLVHGQLIRTGDDEHWLRLAMHHMITDGWSLSILTHELSLLYAAFHQGEADPLPPLQIQYGDYAAWQQLHLQGEVLQLQQQYWIEQLDGAPECLTLPTDRPRPPHVDYHGANVTVCLDADLTSALRDLSQRQGCTLYMTLLASWSALMSRLSGQDEVVVGSPVAGRTRSELEDLIGMFVNTQALRIDLSTSPDVAALLDQVKGTSLQAQAHQDLPFEQVVEAIAPTRSLTYSPIFQVMFALQNMPEKKVALDGMILSSLPEDMDSAQFDLSLIVHGVEDRIEGFLNYATALFDEATVQRYLGYWKRLLQGMVADPYQSIAAIPLLEEAEYQQVIYELNATQTDYPSETGIHTLFTQQAQQSPHALAVISESRASENRLSKNRQSENRVPETQQWDYATLEARANCLAHHLQALGVEKGQRVVVQLPRSTGLIVAELAILKCGAVYVPLDPNAPQERLRFVLSDCCAVVLIAAEGAAMGNLPVHVLMLTETLMNQGPFSSVDVVVGGDAPAYVMYTSGSTGQPKGVVVPHRAIARLVINNGYMTVMPSDRVAFAANPAFDATTMEVWAPLLNGAAVVVIEQNTLLDSHAFATALTQHQVSILWLTVGLFNQYADDLGEVLTGLRYLLVGGDALDPMVIRRVLENYPPQHLLNGYGPTETTTFALTHEIKWVEAQATSIPLGRPIGNTQIYILNDHRQPVPFGVIGEIYIGGDGVALEYLAQPELTAARFVSDPFSACPNARCYKTGDLGYWRPDGTLEFMGRNDFQVKIRGFRIELGEIESALLSCDGVQSAVVVVQGTSSAEKRVVAYFTQTANFTQTTGITLTAAALKAELSESLPDYMLPSAYVALEKMPLTVNGKVDRKALPEADESALVRQVYEAPEGDLEEMLAEIWQELLQVERVGRHDNFFALGGHSLLAAQLISRVRSELDLEVPLVELFSHATLTAFGKRVAYIGLAEFDLSDLIDLAE